ncbi:MAG: caspase family protein [Armatimonadota bacterium]
MRQKQVRWLLFAILTWVATLGLAQAPTPGRELPLVQPHRRALIIGAADYQHLSKLNYPGSDARRFREELISSYRFTPDSIQLISNEPEANAKPTSEGIRDSLEKLLKDPTLNKGDLFILFFSGHGMGTPKGDYLCPVDATAANIEQTGVPVQEIVGKFVSAGLRNVLVITDACRAGDKNDFGTELIELGKKSNIAILLGCEPGTKSYESPKLKSGVFTHFLIRALENKTLRSSMGSLWASSVATSVAKNAFGYTQPDYGNSAQKPTAWTDESKDILLGAFPSEITTRFSLKAIEEEAGKSDPARYSDALLEHATNFAAAGNYEQAIPALKVVESISPDNLSAKFLLACSLLGTGRYGESERLYREIRIAGNETYSPLATLWTPSRSVAPLDRVEAAQQLVRTYAPSEDILVTVWGSMRAYASGSEVTNFCRSILPSTDPNSMIHFILKADLAIGEGKVDEAILAYQTADLCPPTTYVNRYLVRILHSRLLGDLDRYDALISLLKEPFDAGPHQATWLASSAWGLRRAGDIKGSVETAQRAAKTKGLLGDAACLSVQMAGVEAGSLAADLALRLKESPFDWKLRYAALFSEAMQKQDPNLVANAFTEVQKYCDDPVNLLLQVYELNDAIFEDAIENHGAETSVRSDFDNSIYKQWIGLIDKFGTSESLWNKLGITALRLGEGPRIFNLMQTLTGESAVKGRLGNLYYQTRYLLANAAEDIDAMRQCVLAAGVMESDRIDMKWSFAAHLTMVGQYKEAAELTKGLPGGSFMIGPMREVVLAGSKFKSGDKNAFEAILKTEVEHEVQAVAKQIAAVILAQNGRAKEVEKILAEANPNGKVTNQSASIHCVAEYAKLLQKEKRTKEQDDLAYRSSTANIGNPILAAIPFSTPVTVPAELDLIWVGEDFADEKNPTHTLQIDGFGAGSATLKLTSKPDDTVTGTLQIDKGETYTITGKVDPLGNLRASATTGGQSAQLLAKLLPAARIKDQALVLRLPNHKQFQLVIKQKSQ